MTTLIDSLKSLKASLQQLPIDLGVESYQRTLTLAKQQNVDGKTRVSYLTIAPNPKITYVPPGLINRDIPPTVVGLSLSAQTVMLENSDLMVSNIVRADSDRSVGYSVSDLVDNVAYYIVGGMYPDFAGGIRCKALYVNDARSLGLSMILRRLYDQNSNLPLTQTTTSNSILQYIPAL
jgi:hypothetical protein